MDNLHPLVQAVLDSAQFIIACSPFPMNAAVSDTKCYLRHFPIKELDFRTQPGTPIPAGSMADLVLRTGKRHTKRVGAEVFGLPYIGVGVPLIAQDGEVVGCLVTGSPISKQEQTQTLANNLFASVQELTAASQSQASSSLNLADVSKDLAAESSRVTDDINKTDKIISLIKGVANQTQILGLNASIEAARAGIQGAGFAVVANEIRKMGNQTNASVMEISAILKETQQTIANLVRQIGKAAIIAEEQATASEQVGSALSSIAIMAQELNALAETLI